MLLPMNRIMQLTAILVGILLGAVVAKAQELFDPCVQVCGGYETGITTFNTIWCNDWTCYQRTCTGFPCGGGDAINCDKTSDTRKVVEFCEYTLSYCPCTK
jgi:hypothetical protein